MNRSITTWLLLGLCTGSLALNVIEWRRSHTPSPAAWPCDMQECINQLRLTPEQVSRLATSCAPCCSTEQSLDAQIERGVARLEAAIERDEPDHAQIDRELAALSELRDRMLRCRITAILGVRSVLQPDQLVLLRQRFAHVR